MKTPNKIIVLWREVEGYPPYVFHIFQENEIEEARKFAEHAMEKDYDDNTRAHYTINFYEKVLTSQTKL